MKTTTRLDALVEESLRQRPAQSDEAGRKPIRLLTTGAGGVLPGIDVDDLSALMDVMEAALDPP